ncbi:ArpU family phage packaging/lysis transcriptional regulator [Peribacillus loiseleuriae]|uniref:ArpU family phage packaging/lysis transcriptional regulator n=1 Tax=Peribacillus loiseleuriae TaxID=1679170 RepID=UPI003D0107C7
MHHLNDRELKKIVAAELKFYKALKVAMENRNELRESGVSQIFPQLANREVETEIKYKQIHRTLTEVLDHNQRQILERKYLGGDPINDIEIYLDMGLTKDQFYVIKKEAIRLVATALRII